MNKINYFDVFTPFSFLVIFLTKIPKDVPYEYSLDAEQLYNNFIQFINNFFIWYHLNSIIFIEFEDNNKTMSDSVSRNVFLSSYFSWVEIGPNQRPSNRSFGQRLTILVEQSKIVFSSLSFDLLVIALGGLSGICVKMNKFQLHVLALYMHSVWLFLCKMCLYWFYWIKN